MVTRDSTYLNTFSPADFAEFNTDGTCNLGAAHSFYIDGSGYPTIPQAITPVISTVKYSSSGNQYILLTQTGVNFGGITVGDTVTLLAPNKLLIHYVLHSAFPGYEQVSNAYYQK